MFGGTAKIDPSLPPGSPLTVRGKHDANGDIDVSACFAVVPSTVYRRGLQICDSICGIPYLLIPHSLHAEMLPSNVSLAVRTPGKG